MTSLALSILFLLGLLWMVESGWAWEVVDIVTRFLTRVIVDNMP